MQQHDSMNSNQSSTSSSGLSKDSPLGDKIIELQYNWGTGFIQRKDIRSKIKISVKTFHAKRTNYEFTVHITDKLDKLRELLSQREPDEMSTYHVIKLVYSMGTMKSLNLDQTFEQQAIPHGAQLVLLG